MRYSGTSALTDPAFSASSSAQCWHTCVFLRSLPVLWVPIQLGFDVLIVCHPCADRMSLCKTGRRGWVSWWWTCTLLIALFLPLAGLWVRKTSTEAGVNIFPGKYELCSVPSCGSEFCTHFHATDLLNVGVAVKNCSWTIHKKWKFSQSAENCHNPFISKKWTF